MYEHRTAYLVNGEAEGFVGTGSTKARAKADAINQIKRKLDILNTAREQDGDEVLVYVKPNLIESPSTLTKEQIAAVQKDWQSGVRY